MLNLRDDFSLDVYPKTPIYSRFTVVFSAKSNLTLFEINEIQQQHVYVTFTFFLVDN